MGSLIYLPGGKRRAGTCHTAQNISVANKIWDQTDLNYSCIKISTTFPNLTSSFTL